jgi:hypothetical protein
LILSIKVSDEVYEKFGRLNSQNPRHAIEKTLERFADTGHVGKVVVVTGEVLSQLQTILGGTIDTPEALLEKVKATATFRADGAEVIINGYQKAIIEKGALANKVTPEEFLSRKVKQGLTLVLGA